MARRKGWFSARSREVVTPARGRLQSGVREFRIEIDSRSLLSRANCADLEKRANERRRGGR